MNFIKMEKKSKHSQGSMEFIILTGVIIFFLTLFFISVNENISSNTKQKQNLAVEEIAETVKNEINLASKSSDGYSRKFRIPDDINGENYNVSITGKMIYVRTSENKKAIALPVPSLTGQAVKGENIIKKEGGIIYLNP
jgi:hypothetical protein